MAQGGSLAQFRARAAASDAGPKRGGDDDDTAELVSPSPSASAQPTLLDRLESGAISNERRAASLSDDGGGRALDARNRSVAVQRELGKAMAQQKWPAVAPNEITHEGGMARWISRCSFITAV